jgi:hypothetical protein
MNGPIGTIVPFDSYLHFVILNLFNIVVLTLDDDCNFS